MEEWAKLIRELGFPAAIAFFVLWRLDAALREMRDAVRGLLQFLKDRDPQ